MSTSAGPGPLSLVGSGEYLPQMADIEGGLLDGRPPRYVQLATAAVPDGAAVVQRWHRLGVAQAARLGVEAVVLPVNDRHDADDPALAAQVAGAGLVYLSGGHPAYLAGTLRGTAVWAAIVAPGGVAPPWPVAVPGPWRWRPGCRPCATPAKRPRPASACWPTCGSSPTSTPSWPGCRTW